MGAVDVSREGGFLQRSVFGGAARVNDPNHSGTTSSGILRGVKDSLAGGMASSFALDALVYGTRRSALGVLLLFFRFGFRSRMYM
jgi:hypothetical protein